MAPTIDGPSGMACGCPAGGGRGPAASAPLRARAGAAAERAPAGAPGSAAATPTPAPIPAGTRNGVITVHGDAAVLGVARRLARKHFGAARYDALDEAQRDQLLDQVAAAAILGARRKRAAEARRCSPPPGVDPAPYYEGAPAGVRACLRRLLDDGACADLRAGRAVVVDGFAPPRAVAAIRAALLARPRAATLQSTLGQRDDAVSFFDERAENGAAGLAVRFGSAKTRSLMPAAARARGAAHNKVV